MSTVIRSGKQNNTVGGAKGVGYIRRSADGNWHPGEH